MGRLDKGDKVVCVREFTRSKSKTHKPILYNIYTISSICHSNSYNTTKYFTFDEISGPTIWEDYHFIPLLKYRLSKIKKIKTNLVN